MSWSGGPKCWDESRVPKIILPLRQLYRVFVCENVVTVVRVKIDSAWLFITLIEWLICKYPSFFEFSCHSIKVGIAELIFRSLIRISALNPKSTDSWHLPRRELSRLGEPKCSDESRIPKIILPLKQLYRVFVCENVAPVSQVKVDPARLFITLIKLSNVQIFLLIWFSLGHSITLGFAELIFSFLIQISAFKPKSRHYVTLATPRIVLVRRAEVFIWRKFAEAGSRSSCKQLIEFFKEIS